MAGPAFAGPTPDILGTGYEAFTAELPDDAEGAVVATLVRYRTYRPTTRAVLYLHGFSDYFHQVELAEFHATRGETFYALDLHKYGRSLRSHQTPARMADVSDYYPELDAAVEFITGEGHEHLIVTAHSTGGLIAVLWLHDRRTVSGVTNSAGPRNAGPNNDSTNTGSTNTGSTNTGSTNTGSTNTGSGGQPPVEAVVLNSPFLDVPATWALRALAPRPFGVLAKNRPLMILPSPERSLYQLSIHRSERGVWDFVTDWKPVTGGVVRAEWLAAAQRAIARAHAGLDLECPILVMCSAKSVRTKQWSDELYRGDAVLDADSLARWSTRLGRHVTCIRIVDGMHDLLLSAPEVRQRVYAEITRWLDAYAPAAEATYAPAAEAAYTPAAEAAYTPAAEAAYAPAAEATEAPAPADAPNAN